MSIILTTSIDNADLFDSADTDTLLLADSALTHWYQCDTAYMTLAGSNISAIVDRKGAGDWSQATDASRAAYDATALNGQWGAATFGGSAFYTNAGTAPDFSAAYSIACLAKMNTGSSTIDYVTARFHGGATDQTYIAFDRLSTLKGIHAVHGTGSLIDQSYVPGNWAVAIMSHTPDVGGTTGTLRLRVNGIDIGSAATDNDDGTGTWGFGSIRGTNASGGLHGAISDLMIWNVDILATKGDRLALVEKELQGLSGLNFTPYVSV